VYLLARYRCTMPLPRPTSPQQNAFPCAVVQTHALLSAPFWRVFVLRCVEVEAEVEVEVEAEVEVEVKVEVVLVPSPLAPPALEWFACCWMPVERRLACRLSTWTATLAVSGCCSQISNHRV
jgi:hypothetical protein